LTPPIHIFGIRHHGPGSARRLLHALEELRPETVLIEGPADASALLPLLADPDMVPPVALLVYAADEPQRASFWPFAAFSPEYQAACWAVRNGASLRFIDLPASWRFAENAPSWSAIRLACWLRRQAMRMARVSGAMSSKKTPPPGRFSPPWPMP
jgi:hypothetical protein